MNSVCDIYLFSRLSFSVYYVFKSRMCDLSFEFILHLYSFFVLFYPPLKVCVADAKYWANVIHRFDGQNFLTSKCIENWALFERLTHSQLSALSVCPRGSKPSKASSFFCPVQGRLNKHLLAPGLTLEKISVSRGEPQPFGKFTPAERRGNSL